MRIPINLANGVRYRARELGFAPVCVLAGLAVYPLAIVLAVPGAILLSVSDDIALLAGLSVADPFLTMVYSAVLVFVAAASIGLAIGLLQKNLVRRYFKVDLGRWRLVSMLGACVASVIIVYMIENEDCLIGLMRSPLGDRYNDYYGFMLSLIQVPMIQFTLVMSVIQAVWLFRHIRSSWLWLAANILAGTLFFWLLAYGFGVPSFLSWLVAAIVQALIAGHAMQFLLTQRRRGGKAKRDDSSIALGQTD